MQNERHISTAITYITERFDVAAPDVPTLEGLREVLAAHLAHVLDHRYGRLSEMLYRIDLDEQRVNQLMAEAPIDAIPHELADMIIERTIQKMRTRERYRNMLGPE